uniref:Uncharacterized protein n=1 Tax=Fervidicoccus fontis TaxID=683846 RepID=A0A7J3ZKW4_9CREN
MTIYWLRCDICEKSKPVSECRLPGTNTPVWVCASCYTLLSLERFCQGVWRVLEGEGKATVKKERLRELEELLEMLE